MALPSDVDLDRVAPPFLRQLFPLQNRVIGALALDRFVSRRVVALCGRRGGKTFMASGALSFALDCAGFNEDVVYIARTRKVAKGLMWGQLKRIKETCRPEWKVNEAELTITTPAGATLHIVGIDKEAEVEKLRGMKLRLVVCDEPATYAAFLVPLFRDVVRPALGDVRGSILLCGTPGPVCAGFWWEVSTGQRKGWRRHHWTVVDNPHFPDPQAYLDEVLEEEGWDETEIAFLREYRAKWVNDDSALVYRFQRSRNVVSEAPKCHIHTIGVDFGMENESAWTVLGSPRHSKETYVLHSEKHQDLLPEQAAQITKTLCDRYNPDVLVGDAGGLGKPYVTAFNRRFGDDWWMANADKTEKRAHIDMLNGDLRKPNFFLVVPDDLEENDPRHHAEPLAAEMEVLPWAPTREGVPGRMKEHPMYPNHCADGALYGHRHHMAYLNELAESAKPPPSPDSEEYIEEEARRLVERDEDEWWDDSDGYE